MIHSLLRYLITILYIHFALFLSAQVDTVFLESIEIPGSLEEYANGLMVSEIDSITNKQFEGNNLAEAIQQGTGAYIRSYGAEGQPSTISFRGTTPNHTIVKWNGVDINSQTLGQSDFSSIPVFMFSEINVYHGASSTLFGSGGIGGTIDLTTGDFSNDGFRLFATQQLGSYGKSFTGLKAGYGNEKWSTYLLGFYHQIQNDFEVNFRNQKYLQNNAASSLSGILSGIRYFVNRTSTLSLEMWYNRHDRQLQPIVGDLNGDDHLLDNNLRTNLTYKSALKTGFLQAGISWIDERQTYDYSSNTNLKRLIANGEYELTKFSGWSSIMGGNVTLALPQATTYPADTSQWRGDIYFLNKLNLFNSLLISLNLRQPFMEGLSAPIIPSVGVDWTLLTSHKSQLALFGSGSRSFRFPTLNDLFWQPGGNPDLIPEDGISIEAGIKHRQVSSKLVLETQWSLYRSWLDHMIVWVPGGAFWQPENVREVDIFGSEVISTCKFLFERGSWVTNFSYAYNQSQYQSNLSDSDQSAGNQLAYVPLHKGVVSSAIDFDGWMLSYRQSYTGMRFTESTNTSQLPSFGVGTVSLAKNIRFKDHHFSLRVDVNNLWDTDYMNYELRATPGRNYVVRIDYQIN